MVERKLSVKENCVLSETADNKKKENHKGALKTMKVTKQEPRKL